MGTGQRRSALSYIPGFKNNAVLRLILFCAGAYLTLAICWALITIIYSGSDLTFRDYFVPNIALGSLHSVISHPWVILTYGWFQYPNSFWVLLSNMLWLYCFGSVVQMLVGHKQVIPLFAYSLFVGGLFYTLAKLAPISLGSQNAVYLGPNAGLMGMAIAAITISPKYRFYLTETFTIPLIVVAGVFAGLMVLGTGFSLPLLLMLLGGGLMGFLYIILLRGGFKPGDWAYALSDKIESLVTPSAQANRRGQTITMSRSAGRGMYEPRQGISQRRIDEILDKINQKGYNSLSKEEKEMLLQAGRE